MSDQGHIKDSRIKKPRDGVSSIDSFVLNVDIFSNVFEKDIRRVYVYKKAERLAQAIHLIGPAFSGTSILRGRLEAIAIALIDAATLPLPSARAALSRELLMLSSVLAIARTTGDLSPMNVDLIARETLALLEEIAAYEAPRLSLPEAPTLAALSRRRVERKPHEPVRQRPKAAGSLKDSSNGQRLKDSHTSPKPDRREAVLSVLRAKGPSYIKDIALVVPGVSEKTIQRELALLVAESAVEKKGKRRWTTYSIL